jgi:hypothetical protein
VKEVKEVIILVKNNGETDVISKSEGVKLVILKEVRVIGESARIGE